MTFGNHYDRYKGLLNFYVVMYIFTMFNREFQPYGFDFRFIVFITGILLLVAHFISNGFVLEIRKHISWGMFYIWAFMSNMMWLINGLPLNQDAFYREVILLSNVFVGFLVFTLYFNDVEKRTVDISVVISGTVLAFSMFITFIGIPLERIGGNPDYAYIYSNVSAEDLHYNILGMGFRVGGYANDPNYASILLIGAFVTLIGSNFKTIIKFIFSIVFLTMYGLALSKTVFIALILGLVLLGLRKMIMAYVSQRDIYDIVLFAIVMFISFVLYKFDYLRDNLPGTVTIRFRFWENAYALFLRSPVIGSGITSFRSYFDVSHWYVQAHNTYWQVLSELGVIGFILYIVNLMKSISMSRDNYSWFLSYLFIFWIVSCESIALQFSVFFLLIQHIGKYESYEFQPVEQGCLYE